MLRCLKQKNKERLGNLLGWYNIAPETFGYERKSNRNADKFII